MSLTNNLGFRCRILENGFDLSSDIAHGAGRTSGQLEYREVGNDAQNLQPDLILEKKITPRAISACPVALVMCREQATQVHGVRTQMCRFFLQLNYSHAMTLDPQESSCRILVYIEL